MKTALILFALLPSIALAQSAPRPNGTTTTTTSNVTAAGGASLTLKGRPADGSTAVAVIFDTSAALANTSAKLISGRNNAVEYFSFDYKGHLNFVDTTVNANNILMPNSTRICWGAPTGCISLNSANELNMTTIGDVALNAVFYQPRSLVTCSSGTEGFVMRDTLSGVATGNATRLCLCRSDGASTYTWRNLMDPTTAGTSTTCPN